MIPTSPGTVDPTVPSLLLLFTSVWFSPTGTSTLGVLRGKPDVNEREMVSGPFPSSRVTQTPYLGTYTQKGAGQPSKGPTPRMTPPIDPLNPQSLFSSEVPTEPELSVSIRRRMDLICLTNGSPSVRDRTGRSTVRKTCDRDSRGTSPWTSSEFPVSSRSEPVPGRISGWGR